jgi:hypothetical protein
MFVECWARGHHSPVRRDWHLLGVGRSPSEGGDWLFVFRLHVESLLGSVLKKYAVRSRG